MKLSDDLITFTSKLMLIQERREAVNLAQELATFVDKIDNLENIGNATKQKSISATLKFTMKEISQVPKMSKTFKKEFIANGLCAHIIKRPSGKHTFYYEIRYRRNGYNLRAGSTNLAEAKKNFLKQTEIGEIEKHKDKKKKTSFNRLEEVFEEWYEFKRGSIEKKTLKSYFSDFQNLPEEIRKKSITEIRTRDIAECFRNVTPRKYEDLRTLFNSIFKYAIASGIILHNPVSLIAFKRAERQNRECVSTNGIIAFLTRIRASKYNRIRQAAYLLYFFGLRPCEIDEETHREGNFLITRNRKRKNGKIEYKKIPIPLQAQGLINWDEPLTFQVSEKIYEAWFRELLDGLTAYNLRHTFSTICQQAVRPDIVDIWLGDSPTRLVGKVYTHFPDDFMKEQMEKVKFPLFNEYK